MPAPAAQLCVRTYWEPFYLGPPGELYTMVDSFVDPLPPEWAGWQITRYPDFGIRTTDGRHLFAGNDGELWGTIDYVPAAIFGQYFVTVPNAPYPSAYEPYSFHLVTVTPEPGSFALVALGAGLAAAVTHRRRRVR
jgi:hypothetical protein